LRLERVPDSEVDALYSAADAIVMPYHRIEASGVLSKALAHGLAVIASDTGGFSEFLRHDETALLCPVGDAAAFGNAIADLIADPSRLERLAMNARSLGNTTPSWSEIGARTVELYQHVIAQTGRSPQPVGSARRQAPTSR
jgi:glycosyltransferase involved in cell wall biosynthesis